MRYQRAAADESLTLLFAVLLAQQKPDPRRRRPGHRRLFGHRLRRRGERSLKVEDFILRDNGQAREIRNLWRESDLPLTVALVADVSGSQAGFVKSHRAAIAQFLKQVIGPRDRAMIAEVDKQTRLISDLTGSLDDLSAAVQKLGAREGKQSPLLVLRAGTRAFPEAAADGALAWPLLLRSQGA